MTTLSLSRAEFLELLETTEAVIQQRRHAELRRLRRCAQLAREIARIVDRYPRKPYRQIAAELGVDEGTRLLELIDLLEAESREYEPVQVQRCDDG
jgi:hypothetical protein